MPEHATRPSIVRAFADQLTRLFDRVRPRPPLAVSRKVYDFTELVAASPAMVEALSDPRVLRLFREQPSTLDELAALMRLAADSPASPAANGRRSCSPSPNGATDARDHPPPSPVTHPVWTDPQGPRVAGRDGVLQAQLRRLLGQIGRAHV